VSRLLTDWPQLSEAMERAILHALEEEHSLAYAAEQVVRERMRGLVAEAMDSPVMRQKVREMAEQALQANDLARMLEVERRRALNGLSSMVADEVFAALRATKEFTDEISRAQAEGVAAARRLRVNVSFGEE